MLNRDPTFLGTVARVSGSTVNVQLSRSVSSGLSIIEGRTYRIGQVGSFVRIPQGYQAMFGVVSEVGAHSDVETQNPDEPYTGRWLQVQLVGETLAGVFDRGISQYPNIGDNVHIATESDLAHIYSSDGFDQVVIGSLSSAESIQARIGLDELVTRHSAMLGSTGSGKSTTVASLLRSITDGSISTEFPSARILLIDIHGEYGSALSDVATVFSVDPQDNEHKLHIPYWALDTRDLLQFLTGGIEEPQESVFTDKILELKKQLAGSTTFSGIDQDSITVDTPLPFSLKQLWYDLIDIEIKTFRDIERSEPATVSIGDADELTAPTYEPHAQGAKGPFLNSQANGIRRQLNLLRSRMLDRRYDFLLHPGDWNPDLNGKVKRDMDELLKSWLGGSGAITILDLSSVPSTVLERLVGTILKIVYEALFWSREKSEGGVDRPLLVVMEEAHRYLSSKNSSVAGETVNKIAKEGRKYGVGAMVISQRPSEIDETVLSQCGTFFVLRLSNPSDRQRIQGSLPDGLMGLLDVVPVLRTGEAIVMGEASKLPMRCRITLPPEEKRPQSEDPLVAKQWALPRKEEGYDRIMASWRAQDPRAVVKKLQIHRYPVEEEPTTNEEN